MKTCTKCKEAKDLTEFHKKKAAKDGLKSQCKVCRAKHHSDTYVHDSDKRRATYLANKTSENARMREHYQNNKYQYRANWAAYNARKLDQTPELSEDEKDEVKMIYALSASLSQEPDFGPQHVDHIVALANGGLHHPDNLQILTAEANLRKGAN